MREFKMPAHARDEGIALRAMVGAATGVLAFTVAFGVVVVTQPTTAEARLDEALVANEATFEPPAQETPPEPEPVEVASEAACDEVEPVIEQDYDYADYEPYAASDSFYGDADGFRTDGIVYDGGETFTWYSENVLPGGGLVELNSNGRHVDDDGVIRDADGYVAVATPHRDEPIGTVVDTPLGEGKVYDYNVSGFSYDVYTSW